MNLSMITEYTRAFELKYNCIRGIQYRNWPKLSSYLLASSYISFSFLFFV